MKCIKPTAVPVPGQEEKVPHNRGRQGYPHPLGKGTCFSGPLGRLCTYCAIPPVLEVQGTAGAGVPTSGLLLDLVPEDTGVEE